MNDEEDKRDEKRALDFTLLTLVLIPAFLAILALATIAAKSLS